MTVDELIARLRYISEHQGYGHAVIQVRNAAGDQNYLETENVVLDPDGPRQGVLYLNLN